MAKRPKIVITSSDMERLESLLDKTPDDAFPGKADLESELMRAEVVDSGEVPADVVTMNSTVRFSVADSPDIFSMTLVYPHQMDGSNERISILAPVGSALLGLAEGNEIEWPRPGGGSMRVRIDKVLQQPERAAETG